ncbi:MAG: hypothetical protein WC277_07810 [Bacilli bacterium]|jgi:hypothetical protein
MACKCPRDPPEIRITLDGDKWCALRGENLQVGESGFGDSPEGALRNLLRIEKLTEEYVEIKATLTSRCKPPGEPFDTCTGCPYLIKDQCLRSMIFTCLTEGTQPIYIGISTSDLVNELRSREGVKELQVAPGDIYQIKTLDGQKKDQDMISRGENLQEGKSGFGNSPEEALRNLIRIEKRTAEYDAIQAAIMSRCEPPGKPEDSCTGCLYLVGGQCFRSGILNLLAENSTDPFAWISTADLLDELIARAGVILEAID